LDAIFFPISEERRTNIEIIWKQIAEANIWTSKQICTNMVNERIKHCGAL
jgi:hypothetical protein